jgi:chaperonin cofactor prefoldin|tara:strand:- start:11 stop:172 length:162 start_codon:yes stop_codon:yes gene_type:complete
MTYSEDVRRTSNYDTIHFLNMRIEALEKRVEYLEKQNKWIENEFNINNLNKKQ